jgi:nitroreductase
MDIESVDQILMTTRSVRKRLDLKRPVEPEIIKECLEIAIQAPSGSDRQGWHFLVVTDAAKRAAVGALYKKSFIIYRGGDEAAIQVERQTNRLVDSAMYLAEHMHEVPVLLIACYEGRPQNPEPFGQAGMYGSILPAAWSLMLALRARGLGSAWTTLHLRYEKEVAEILGIPDTVSQCVLLPIAYYTGEGFHPASRQAADKVTYWDEWGKKSL